MNHYTLTGTLYLGGIRRVDSAEEMCQAQRRKGDWICNREKGHAGVHAAFSNGRIAAVWEKQ